MVVLEVMLFDLVVDIVDWGVMLIGGGVMLGELDLVLCE